MTKAILGLFLVSATLAACSNGGGSGDDFQTEMTVNTSEVPENPLSNGEIKAVLSKIHNAEKYIPNEKLLLKKVIDNMDAVYVAKDSKEFKEKYNRLTPEGLEILKDMQANCELKDAHFTKEEKPSQLVSGAKQVLHLASSIGGPKCLMENKTSAARTTTFSNVEGNASEPGGIKAYNGAWERNEISSTELKGKLRSLSGFSRAMTITNQSGKSSYKLDKDDRVEKYRVRTKIQMSFDGQGDSSLRATLETEFLSKGREKVGKLRFAGSTRKGNFVLYRVERGLSATNFLNGREYSTREVNEILGGFMKFD